MVDDDSEDKNDVDYDHGDLGARWANGHALQAVSLLDRPVASALTKVSLFIHSLPCFNHQFFSLQVHFFSMLSSK